MTQTRRDPSFREALGRRLDVLVKVHLPTNWSELAERLGYENDSVLRQARKGRTCLSAEKLAALAALKFEGLKERVSIDWLLTGEGRPMRSAVEDASGYMGEVARRVEKAPSDVQQTISAYLDVQESVAKP